ncbi:MAG: tRNA lysidine(34) synthetase TilS [Kiritimatiellae bacterium]|nr:tRNA lysidine(34) synthetase TilS [Kiritimatiellia bacterium]
MKVNRAILPPGRIGLAVSGGSDSVALAFLLTKGGKKKNAAERFVVLHVDHGLRKESKEEYRFVKALAKRLGIPFRGTHAKVVKAPGESLEMAARSARLAFFGKCMKSLKLDAIATGHHMDDVAETFLMRIRRVSGPVGLAGIKEKSEVGSIRFVRPLLGCRDSELKDYLRKYREEWREDASNDDVSIERNRVRHEVIPFLEKTLDPNLVEHIAKITGFLRDALGGGLLRDGGKGRVRD